MSSRRAPAEGAASALPARHLIHSSQPVTVSVLVTKRQHRLCQGWPCHVSLQPCKHEEGVDSSLEFFNLQIHSTALSLPGDGHCEELQAKHIECQTGSGTPVLACVSCLNFSGPFTRSAVTVEGDRAVFSELCRSRPRQSAFL